MFGLEFIVAGMLHFAPEMKVEPVLQEVKCVAKSAPRINVVPTKSRVKYDYTKTKAQLNSVNVDTVSPYGPQHKTSVSGLMSGSIQVSHQVGFVHEKYEQLDQGCVYLKTVDIKVHIEPTIFIAKEYPPGSCMHNAVMTHERKHVREDQLVVNKYAAIIGRAMGKVVNSQGAAFGPYEIVRMPIIQENVQNSLNTVLKRYNQDLNNERRTRQQAIDSFEEYESIGKRCKKSK